MSNSIRKLFRTKSDVFLKLKTIGELNEETNR